MIPTLLWAQDTDFWACKTGRGTADSCPASCPAGPPGPSQQDCSQSVHPSSVLILGLGQTQEQDHVIDLDGPHEVHMRVFSLSRSLWMSRSLPAVLDIFFLNSISSLVTCRTRYSRNWSQEKGERQCRALKQFRTFLLSFHLWDWHPPSPIISSKRIQFPVEEGQ